ncbi:hypothetical protein D018_0692A, partial [Vibrio parahaemolyticus VP2007-007]
MLVAIGDL